MGGSQSTLHDGQRSSSLLNEKKLHSLTSRGSKRAESSLQLKSLLSPFVATTACAAADAAPPLPPPPPGSESAPAPPPPAPDSDDSIAEAAKAASAFTSPGPYEQAAMDAKRLVSLDTFDGFRCDINKQVSPFMVGAHSFWLGTSMLPDGRKSTYTFLTQVAEETGLLMARVDPGRGSVDGRIHRAVLGGLAMAKVQIGVSTEGQGDQVLGELDFGGLTWTGNLKYGSMGGGLVYGCNYFQAITPSLAMGGEGMYIAANQTMLSNYTAKYTMKAKTGDEDAPIPVTTSKPAAPGMPPPEVDGSSTVIANFNGAQQALTLNYKRVVTPNRVTLGAELQCNPFTLESNLLVGAEFKLQRSKLAFCVDGNGRIQSVVEARLGMSPDSPSLQFAADMDHFKEEMRFGYGITING